MPRHFTLPMPRRGAHGAETTETAEAGVAARPYRLERRSASGKWKALSGAKEVGQLLEKGPKVEGAVRVCKRDGTVLVEWLDGKAVTK